MWIKRLKELWAKDYASSDDHKQDTNRGTEWGRNQGGLGEVEDETQEIEQDANQSTEQNGYEVTARVGQQETMFTKFMKKLQRFWHWQESIWIGVVVVCIAILGEMNFYSTQVYWQSEPFSAVGGRFSSLASVG